MSRQRHGTRLGWNARGLVVVTPVTGGGTLRYALTSSGQLQSLRQLGRIEGRIDSAALAGGPLVVVLTRTVATESRSGLDVDTFVRPGPGRFAFAFAFAVTPGRHGLSAYEDRNKSGRIDPGEPTWPQRTSHTAARGGEAPIEVSHVVAEAPREEVAFSPWRS